MYVSQLLCRWMWCKAHTLVEHCWRFHQRPSQCGNALWFPADLHLLMAGGPPTIDRCKKHHMSYRVSVGMSHDVTPSSFNASFTAVPIWILTWAPDGGVSCTAESPQVTSEWGRNITWSYTVFVIDVIQDVTLCLWFILVSRPWMDDSLSYSQQEIRVHNMILIHTLAYPKLHSMIEV